MTISAKIKSFKATIALFVALVTFMQNIVAQTTIAMPMSGSRIDTLHAGSSYSLLDPGGTSNYPASCHSTLTIVSDSGTAITISGMLHTDYSYAYLYIYEGTSVNRPMAGTYSGLQNVNVTLPTGKATLVFSSTNANTFNGFQFTVTVCDIHEGIVRDVTVGNLTPDSATLDWSGSMGGTSTPPTGWTLNYGTVPNDLSSTVTTTNPTVTLSGLSPNTTYYYSVFRSDAANSPCSSIIKTFRTTCTESREGGIDYSNLQSCYVKATYGTFNGPMQYAGIVDSGSNSHLSRHTVHTDTSETDPRSGNQLHTVPPGYSSSVRLGNWDVNSQAETITYEYTVDTNFSDLLIMKYAALLQVPNHSTIQRPRFKFQIFDENECEINSNCYSADFVANTELGWNIYDPFCFDSVHLTTEAVLWKDWTTVGIDLAPLHGQTIMIRLSTYDCAHGQHYGYAYFVIDCNHKTLVTENCGCQIENTFTVPEGFSYRWYKVDTMGNDAQSSPTLSTERSLHVTQPGEYRCQLSFIGAPTGASCSFEMQAIAGERYPAAIMSIDSSRTDNCDIRINLHNNSLIATDSLRQHLTSLPCEGGLWIVDGQVLSSTTDDSVIFSPGDHTIQLVASLSNGNCTDTATMSIHVAELKSSSIISDTIVENQLPYTFLGATFTESVQNTTFTIQNAAGCDSTINYSLHVWPNVSTLLDSTVCDTQLPLVWNGHTFDSNSSIQTSQFTIPNRHGADSTVTMTLHVKSSSQSAIHDTIVENQLPYTFIGTVFNESIQNTTFLIQNAAGCDSTINYSLYVWPNVFALLDSTICDTQLPLVWNGHTFDGDSSIQTSQFTILNCHGADSTVTMTLHVKSSSQSVIHDTIVENQLPHSFMGTVFSEPIQNSTFTIQNSVGCDSTIHYSLHVWPNVYTSIDSVICADRLPFQWHGNVVTDLQPDTLALLQSGSQSSSYNFQFSTLNCHGADSTVTLLLTVHPVYDIHFADTICDNELPYILAGHTLTTSVNDSTLVFRTIQGCDSTVHLNLTVNPTHQTTLHDTICDNQLPYIWEGITFNDSVQNSTFTVQNSSGCDSTVSLILTVHPTHHTYHRAVVCNGVPYHWIDGNTYSYSTYSPHIDYHNIYGCDSILHLLLDLDNNFKASMEIAPTTVDLDHPEVRLRDRSESHSRHWFILGKNPEDESTIFFVDTARISRFMFPADKDSLQVLLVASTMAGCVDSVWGVVNCDRAVVWAPNAITPNEPQNNRFAIISNQLASGEVWIYDRAGRLVTHFDALNENWDGTYRGTPCPQATYTWIMKYTTILQPRQSRTMKGTVTLLR